MNYFSRILKTGELEALYLFCISQNVKCGVFLKDKDTQSKMGILEKIKDIEEEMARTQKNKATEYHMGLLRGKLAKLRT